jgi:hypothetical protein
MKSKVIYMFWASVFILAGIGLLAGLIDLDQLTLQAQMISMAIASAVFFLSYFLDGIRKWGWLFLALFCAAMAITIWMSINGQDDLQSPAPILASIACRFTSVSPSTASRLACSSRLSS